MAAGYLPTDECVDSPHGGMGRDAASCEAWPASPPPSVLAVSTLGFELWVGALAWHWLRSAPDLVASVPTLTAPPPG